MKLIIFDMDGTLLDSAHDITTSINYVRQEHYGLDELSREFVIEAINRTERNLPKLFYNTQIYEDSARALFEPHYHEQCIQNVRLYDGIKEMLESLKEQGFLMSIATNAPSHFASRMISHLHIENYFEHIVGANLVQSPKPAPDMLELIFKRYEFDSKKDRAWMVGDSSKDMDVAKNVAIPSIFATWGFSKEGSGDYIASHPSQILEIVR